MPIDELIPRSSFGSPAETRRWMPSTAVTITPSQTLMHFILEVRLGFMPSGWVLAIPQLSKELGLHLSSDSLALSLPNCSGGYWVLLFSYKHTLPYSENLASERYHRNKNNRDFQLFLPARCQTHYLKASNTVFLSTIFIFPSQVRK